MELIKRYIYAIERRLPRGSEDIAKEIESIIMDELEGKYGAKGEYTKEEIAPVLSGMGSPRVVAQRYRGGNDYVIGPGLGYIYRMVLGIVAGAVTLGLFISFIVERFTAVNTFWQGLVALGGFFASTFSAVLAAVGSVTLIFMLIERCGDKSKISDELQSTWEPRDLPDLPEEKDKVTVIGPIIVIILSLAWAVFINSYAKVGVGNFPVHTAAEAVVVLPIFNMDVVRSVLPLWNLSILVTIVTQIILLKQGKWTLGTRLLEVLGQMVSIMALVLLIGLAPMFDFNVLGTVDADFNAMLGEANRWYYVGLKVLLVLTAIGAFTNTVKAVVKAVRKSNLG